MPKLMRLAAWMRSKDFAITASVHVEVENDVKAALARLKPEVALYVGGMGHKDKNFHNDIMVRRGFGEAAKRIQELYLAGHKDEAIASVPDEWVDMKSIVGPPARIRERYRAWEDCGADTLNVRSRQPEAIEAMGIKGGEILTDESIGKVSVVGAGMRSHPGVAAKVFAVLGEAGINIHMISTSPIKISCVIASDQVADAVRRLHEAFGLGEDAVRREEPTGIHHRPTVA